MIMKKLVITLTLILSAIVLAGCGTAKQATQLVERTTVDTIYINQLQYDSIFVSQDHFIDRSSDTIYIRDVSVQYKYKLLRDTVRVHQVDSIPVIKEVTVTQEVRYIPWYVKTLAWIGAISILVIIGRLIWLFVFKQHLS